VPFYIFLKKDKTLHFMSSVSTRMFVKCVAQLQFKLCLLNRNVFAELSPACAIVGGVMAQEIIKAVSQKESPHNNMFFLNPTKNVAFVDCIGN
jgi:hypothetical protein